MSHKVAATRYLHSNLVHIISPKREMKNACTISIAHNGCSRKAIPYDGDKQVNLPCANGMSPQVRTNDQARRKTPNMSNAAARLELNPNPAPPPIRASTALLAHSTVWSRPQELSLALAASSPREVLDEPSSVGSAPSALEAAAGSGLKKCLHSASNSTPSSVS